MKKHMLPTITCPADLDKMPWSKNQDWEAMRRRDLCPHTGVPVGECECAHTDETSPFFAYRVAHESGDKEGMNAATAAIHAACNAPLIRHVDLFCIDESQPYALRKAVAERLVAITDPGSEGPMSDEVFAHYLGVTREMINKEPQLLIEPTEYGVRARARGPATKH